MVEERRNFTTLDIYSVKGESNFISLKPFVGYVDK